MSFAPYVTTVESRPRHLYNTIVQKLITSSWRSHRNACRSGRKPVGPPCTESRSFVRTYPDLPFHRCIAKVILMVAVATSGRSYSSDQSSYCCTDGNPQSQTQSRSQRAAYSSCSFASYFITCPWSVTVGL